MEKTKFQQNDFTFADRLRAFRETAKAIQDFETRQSFPQFDERFAIRLQMDACKDIWGAKSNDQMERLWKALRRWIVK